MPVPVTPRKNESSQDVLAPTAGSWVQPIQEAAHTPPTQTISSPLGNTSSQHPSSPNLASQPNNHVRSVGHPLNAQGTTPPTVPVHPSSPQGETNRANSSPSIQGNHHISQDSSRQSPDPTGVSAPPPSPEGLPRQHTNTQRNLAHLFSSQGVLLQPGSPHSVLSPLSSPVSLSEEDEAVDPDVAAGYQDCLKETLRFLLEEEHLPVDHPVVTGLTEHLTREHAHVELTKLSNHIADAIMNQNLPPSNTSSDGVISNVLMMPRTLNTGYEVTLVEDNDSEGEDELFGVDSDGDEGMEEGDMDCISIDGYSDFEESECEGESDLEETQVQEVVMGDPELRRQLLRYVYQGCDLFAAPQSISHTHYPSLVLHL